MNEDLKLFKKFIDENPDYLLILASDHGKNKRSENFVLHGESRDGNEGFLLFYNPKLFNNKNDIPLYKVIDVVDVTPTIVGYLHGVDIPLMSLGIGRNFYGKLFNYYFFILFYFLIIFIIFIIFLLLFFIIFYHFYLFYYYYLLFLSYLLFIYFFYYFYYLLLLLFNFFFLQC